MKHFALYHIIFQCNDDYDISEVNILNFHSKPNIDKIKTQVNVGVLVKALGYEKDKEIRKGVIKAITEICGFSALKAILYFLESTDKPMRN